MPMLCLCLFRCRCRLFCGKSVPQLFVVVGVVVVCSSSSRRLGMVIFDRASTVRIVWILGPTVNPPAEKYHELVFVDYNTQIGLKSLISLSR